MDWADGEVDQGYKARPQRGKFSCRLLKELVWTDLKKHYNGFEEMIDSRLKESEETFSMPVKPNWQSLLEFQSCSRILKRLRDDFPVQMMSRNCVNS